MHVIDKIAEKVRTRCQQQQGVGLLVEGSATDAAGASKRRAARTMCGSAAPARNEQAPRGRKAMRAFAESPPCGKRALRRAPRAARWAWFAAAVWLGAVGVDCQGCLAAAR